MVWKIKLAILKAAKRRLKLDQKITILQVKWRHFFQCFNAVYEIIIGNFLDFFFFFCLSMTLRAIKKNSNYYFKMINHLKSWENGAQTSDFGGGAGQKSAHRHWKVWTYFSLYSPVLCDNLTLQSAKSLGIFIGSGKRKEKKMASGTTKTEFDLGWLIDFFSCYRQSRLTLLIKWMLSKHFRVIGTELELKQSSIFHKKMTLMQSAGF